MMRLILSVVWVAFLAPACGGRKQVDLRTGQGSADQLVQSEPESEVDVPHLMKFRFSGKCMEIDGGRTDDEARAIQAPCNESDRQRFILIEKPDGYLIQNVLTEKCLTASQSATGNGTPITQTACLYVGAQLFEKRSDGNDGFYVKHVDSKRCLQIETNQPIDRLGVELFDCLQNETQRIEMNPLAPDR